MFALRRGYGVTGGTWAEDLGQCPGADFDRAGREAARDIRPVVEYATALPFAQKDGAVVVGHSGGGLGTIAYGSAPHPAVGALVSMAGGRGGHWQFKPNSVCHSERLIESVRRFGRGATIPMLWVYSENDSFFDLSLARVMQQAYLEGGGQAGLQAIAPFDKDGHFVFTGKGGSQLWGPPVERYLAERQAAAQLNLSQ